MREWAFENTEYDCLYSYMNAANTGSYSTAASIGMKRVKEYFDEKYRDMYVYAITRNEWREIKE